MTILRRLEAFLLGALMLAMSFAYTFNVLVRDLTPKYASSFAWIDEASLFGLAWTVFLGLGLTLERGRHISMTALLNMLAPRLRRAVKLAIDLAGLAFSLYIAHICWAVTVLVLKSGQVSPTLNVSMIWIYGPMPAGFALLGLRYALELLGAADRHKLEIDPMLRL
jgi:TRAP-type C4-dicarboxylate transport system permease small subunit